MDSNKNLIEFGVEELHYSIYDAATKTYSTPKRFAAAANFSLTPYEITLNFKGLDGIEKDVETTIAGYDGTLSVYAISEEFLKEVWGYEETESGILVEKVFTSNPQVALLYTSHPYRATYYNCRIKRPNVDLETVAKQTKINKLSLKITIRGTSDNGTIRALCSEGKKPYANWFNEVI